MNLLLLEDGDFIATDRVRLSGRRLKHLHEVHRAEAGDSLRVGRLNGAMGTGHLLYLDANQAELQIDLDQAAPAKLPLTLLLALPRPKMLRRVLQTVAAMGVPRLILLNSYRVEKSFWQTPFLEPAALREQLILGLVGHPGAYPPCPRAVERPVTLAIGPEGGWIPYEVEKLKQAGLHPVQLGERILRVETAVTALLARLF